MAIEGAQRAVYELLTGEDDGRVCRDIPEAACAEQPRNFIRHVLSLAATKTGDGLSDPKLVIAWLLGALGAPAALVGLLVPVREAGALLPQLFIAGSVRAMARRKWAWVAGSLVQGICVIAMAAAALALAPGVAGWTIVGLLAVFAVARSVCSVSYKDVLGKTIAKSTRGTTTGTASTIAAVLVLGFGLLISWGALDRSVPTIAAVLLIAGVLWIASALLFAGLAEQPGATGGGGNPIEVAWSQLGLLREDPQLVRFIATRGLLTATALAPPYLVALAGRASDQQLGQLGPFVVAAALASVASTYVWGRLSDRSSRKVLAISGAIGAIVLAVAAALSLSAADAYAGRLAIPALLFALTIAYQGVRLGRATHVVDMTDEDTRAAYTALSNTIVGLLLLAGGVFSVLAQVAGEPAVLAVFAAMSAGAAIVALGLREVQAGDGDDATQS